MNRFSACLLLLFVILFSADSSAQFNRRNTKKPIPYRANYQRMASGCFAKHAFEIKGGSLWAWGFNLYGQLGDGSTTDKNIPVKIGSDNNWVGVSVGAFHTLGLKSDGTLWAWGQNTSGQLGDGTLNQKNIPVQIGTDNKWISIAAGYDFSLGLKVDGTLWAWGSNNNGQLGDSSSVNHASPVQVGSDNNWYNIAAGNYHGAALKANGTLWTWGKNSDGQLGDSSNINRNRPVQIGTGNNWTSISSGANHCLALKADGTLWVWGNNSDSQLGVPSSTSNIFPSLIGPENNWVSISASTSHSMALKADGTLWAWGLNQFGEVGDGTQLTRQAPVKIGTGDNWVAMSTGQGFSMGLKADGTLYTWGNNGKGQLGDGTNLQKSSPGLMSVSDIETWLMIVAGANHTLGIKENGTLWAWGLNTAGQLGDGTLTQRNSPVQIGTDNNWISVSAGYYFSMGLKADGTLWTWGENSLYGQLGDGTTINKNTPAKIGNEKWISISAGNDFCLAIRYDGTLWGWGRNNNGQLGDGTLSHKNSPIQLSFEPWVAIATGSTHSMGLKPNGSLWTWGFNTSGQLADGTNNTQRNYPLLIGYHSWVSISTGSTAMHAHAIKSDGSLWGWGYNNNGQIGNNSGANFNFHFRIGTENNWLTIAEGGYHSLGIKAGGTLWTWGYDGYGQLGDTYTYNHTNIPAQVGSDTRWIAVSAGLFHSMGLKSDRSTYCPAGYNNYGQLGDGTTTTRTSMVPLPVNEGNWVIIEAGFYHTSGLKSNGSIWAWGSNAYGQLGDSSTIEKRAPVLISKNSSWTSLAVGYYHTLAIQSNGTLWAWGRNDYGQLGDGSLQNRTYPVQVGTDSNWKSIACGGYHNLAIQTNGTLWAWGYNSNGQLGIANILNQNHPVQVGMDSNWQIIAGGGLHSLAIQINGKLFSWGSNGLGQLGDSSNNESHVPVQIGSDSWTKIKAGQGHSLAIKADSTLWSWGYNNFGQLGDGSSTNRNQPAQIGTNKWKEISAGYYHSLFIKNNGNLWATGYNNSGQLGIGNTLNQLSPVQVGTNNWTLIFGSYYHSVGMKAGLNQFCTTGNNSNGQLGDNTIVNKSSFVCNTNCIPPPTPDAVSDVLFCNGKPASFSILGTGIRSVYSAASGGTYLGRFFPPQIKLNVVDMAVYYLQDSTCMASINRKPIRFNILPTPVVTATASSNPVCIGKSTTLTGGGALTYSWTNGISNGVAFIPTTTKTYVVTGTDTNGCTNTATLNVPVNSMPNKTTSLYLATISATQFNASYQWLDCNNGNLPIAGATDRVFTASKIGDYSVIVNLNGCPDTSVCVNISCIPPLPVSANKSICKGNSTMLSATGSDNLGWYSTGTGGVLLGSGTTFTTPVLYKSVTYFIQDSTCAKSIIRTPVTISVDPDTSLSTNGKSITSNQKGASYQWLDCSKGKAPIAGETNQSFTPSEMGVYAVKVSYNGCIDTSACLFFCEIPPAPQVQNKTICKGTQTTLIANGVAYISWYDAQSGGNFLGSGPNFLIPIIKNSVVFYAQDSSCLGASPRSPDSVTVIPNAVIYKNNQNLSTYYLAEASYQWWDCDLHQVIPFANAYSYFVSKTGNFAVIVTLNNCNDTSKCMFVKFVGIEEMTLANYLKIFPNPSPHSFTVQSEFPGKYSLINPLGQTMEEFELNADNNYSKSFEGFEAGIYFVTGNNRHGITRQKVIVTK